MRMIETEIKYASMKKQVQNIDKEIDLNLRHLFHNTEIVYDRNRDYGQSLLQLYIVLDDVNLEEFDIFVNKIKELFEKRRAIRKEQNRLEKEMDVEEKLARVQL